MVAMGSWRTNRKGASPFLAALLLLCLVPAIASGQIRQRTVPDTKPAHLGTQGNQEAEVDTRTDVVYVDCFTEPAHSTLHVLDVQLRDVTRAMFRSPAEQKPPTCARACWIAGYPYVGVKGYYQCWCGKEVKLRLFPRGRCMACLGSFQYRCGMTDSIAIYKVNQVPPQASVCQGDRTAVAGATVTLQCLASGDEPIQFMWKLPRFNPRAFVNGGSLTIRNVQPSDNGEYLCTAKNPYIGMPALRTSNATARLTVQTPPTAQVKVLQLFSLGHAGTLLCEASGDRPLQLGWLIGNTTVSLATLNTANLAVTYDHNAGRSTLTVKNVTKDSEGFYYCEATNNHIIDLSKRSFKAPFYFSSEHGAVTSFHQSTSAQTATLTTKRHAFTTVAKTEVHAPTVSQVPDRTKDSTDYNVPPMKSGFFGLGVDTMTVVAILCGVCAVLLLLLTMVVCYWQRRKVAELDEKRHTARLSTGHVLGSTGSYLYPSVSDSDSTGMRTVNGDCTMESSLAHHQSTESADDKDADGDEYDLQPRGASLHDMYVLDEEGEFQAPRHLDPLSTSYFERGGLASSAGTSFFTNPSVSDL
eukprot:scpid37047/ scgid4174/ Neuronal growth regulator 1